MIYIPMIQRTVTVNNPNLTAFDVTKTLSQMEDTKITQVESNVVVFRKINYNLFYHNSYLPVSTLTLIHKEKCTELTVSSHLCKSSQYVIYTINMMALLMEIIFLINSGGLVPLPALIPIGIILFSNLISVIMLSLQTNRICKQLKHYLNTENNTGNSTHNPV